MAGVSAAFDRVDALFEAFHQARFAPSVAYGVVADGRLVHTGGFGTLDPAASDSPAPGADTVFRIASMSKSFTATAIVILRDRGLLRLDDPVATYVPQLESLQLPTSDSPALTIRHLLTMSGGLPTDDPWGDRQESLGPQEFSDLLTRGFRFVAAPGMRYEYSNLGFAILGRVIQTLHRDAGWVPSGLPGHTAFHDFVRAEVIAPLGLNATGYGEQTAPDNRMAPGWRRGTNGWVPVPPVVPGAFSAMGGAHSTVRDLAGWVNGFLDAFPARDGTDEGHPLSRASRRDMQQQHRAAGVAAELCWPDGDGHTEGPALTAGSVGYGFGLFVEQIAGRGDVVSHSGGYPGYGSHMRWHPASGIGVIALANGTYAGPGRTARAALDTLLETTNAPRQHTMAIWPDTEAAARTIHSLLATGPSAATFAAATATGTFAMNIDLDQPPAERLAALAEIADRIGIAAADSTREPAYASEGPAHTSWTEHGTTGERAVSIRLSPEREPRVQTLAVTAISAPSDALLKAAAAIVHDPAGPIQALGGDPLLDERPTAAASPNSATFEIRAGRVRWRLAVEVNDGGDLLASTLTATV